MKNEISIYGIPVYLHLLSVRYRPRFSEKASEMQSPSHSGVSHTVPSGLAGERRTVCEDNSRGPGRLGRRSSGDPVRGPDRLPSQQRCVRRAAAVPGHLARRNRQVSLGRLFLHNLLLNHLQKQTKILFKDFQLLYKHFNLMSKI